VVEDGNIVLSNVIASSVDLHAKTGGVVPEVAAREHILQISPILDKAMEDARVTWNDIDAIAVTHAPGLVAALLIGLNTAQALAFVHNKPLVPIHHVSGHIYANFLEREESIRFPIVVLTVSGGHNDLVLMTGHHEFKVLGESLDDAAGEAFDKVARLLSLGFPGGPIIAKTGATGNPGAYNLPRSFMDEKDQVNRYNFSFSGLKTAVRNLTQKVDLSDPKVMADVAASFEAAVVDVLSEKLIRAVEEFGAKEAHLAGGVSANQRLRKTAELKLAGRVPLVYPKKLIYCTDNAAMVAASAYYLIQKRPEVLKTDWRKIEVYSQLPLGS